MKRNVMQYLSTGLLALTITAVLAGADAAPLAVEAKIPLGDINGRIDHLPFDPKRERLYVAELGNNSVGIVDMKARRVVRTVSGFDEPQGIAYEPSTDTVWVASGGDGSVRVFGAEDFGAVGRIALGDDADNVRLDRNAARVYVGYGDGALAVIDRARGRVGAASGTLTCPASAVFPGCRSSCARILVQRLQYPFHRHPVRSIRNAAAD